ncbi:MAG: integrase/recombinase XerD [Polaribacter sp.]|jgi:integrase/recombinase XerD
MKAIIYNIRPNARRIQFYLPPGAKKWRERIKAIPGRFYHHQQKLWSVVNTKENLALLKQVFGASYEEQNPTQTNAIPKIELSEPMKIELARVHEKIILKAYAHNTWKAYRGALTYFFKYFESRKLLDVTKAEIEGYVAKWIVKYKISETKQNTIINAIKFYYEQVLEQPREFYDIQRPKKSQTLPGVLSMKEVYAVLEQPKNIKHKAILFAIYSGGLRLSEVLNLRIEDVRSADGYIFIKGGKGKKDRRTVLSVHLLEMLRVYYVAYKPSYWLFEGQAGGKYSASSVQSILRKAVKDSNVNPWATVHTLRHSFATHLMQQGTNTRYIQGLLGHSSLKTTEIYTHLMKVDNSVVKSPLDIMMESITLVRT